jgi:hypothetical protein
MPFLSLFENALLFGIPEMRFFKSFFFIFVTWLRHSNLSENEFSSNWGAR